MKLNVLSFTPVTEEITVHLWTQKAEKTFPDIVKKEECPEIWEQNPELLAEKKFLYCTYDEINEVCKGDHFAFQFNPYEFPRIGLNYFRYKIHNYFNGKVPVVNYNFINGVEIWIDDLKNNKTTKYNKFTLKPQFARVSQGFELLVTFDGQSVVYNTPVTQLSHIEPELFSLVMVNGGLAKYKKLSSNQKELISQTYPVLNAKLEKKLGIQYNRYLNQNKYISTFKLITDFCNSFIAAKDFQSVIKIADFEFMQVPEHKIFHTTWKSNSLIFGQDKSDISPFEGMKNGPYQPPVVPQNKVRFFFIFHNPDFAHVKKINDIFSNGYIRTNQKGYTNSFPSLADYIKQPFHTDQKGSIPFNNMDTAIQEIDNGLSKKKFVKDCTYVAIFISPVRKDDIDSPYHTIYYKLKELLLNKGITSQVIYKERYNDEFFSIHLPNIAIAILAKLGGIPWKLQDKGKNDLIVGVGAFKSMEIGKRYIGSAFSFNSDGIFQNFACHQEDDLELLVANIRKALMHYVVENETAERLIIHYYKTMSKKEAKPILNMLYKLGLTIPVIIVTINKTESQDMVGFDIDSADLMPESGTVVRVGQSQFLLYNNAKYDDTYSNKKGKKDYPFPVKLTIKSANEDFEFTKELNAELIDQIYKFSRMYWKSVKQQNLPITIKYPEMVAEIVPHFSEPKLPPFGESNLWFL